MGEKEAELAGTDTLHGHVHGIKAEFTVSLSRAFSILFGRCSTPRRITNRSAPSTRSEHDLVAVLDGVDAWIVSWQCGPRTSS